MGDGDKLVKQDQFSVLLTLSNAWHLVGRYWVEPGPLLAVIISGTHRHSSSSDAILSSVAAQIKQLAKGRTSAASE